ncbi:MAG: ATP-binding cassette domain-containing protein, partial [Bacteroidaceae bacterium]|nr:ATP-binding cassette domain-containing protein [Bacteroidaceae bacterium]
MNKITLDNTLPKVFLQRTDIQSDIWRQQVTFEKGKTYLIEAQSGTGKSSLCSFIIGYRQDFDGKILFDGKDSRRLKVKEWIELRQKHISLLFQELRLFPELTAMENIEIKNSLTHHKQRKEIEGWFEALGIADKMASPVRLMSFGQQQRVAMIRALVQPFDFLLCDEPISHLDDENSQIMANIMTEEARKQGAGIIITSIGKHMELPYDK